MTALRLLVVALAVSSAAVHAQFGPEQPLPNPAGGDIISMASADIDGDGDLDVVVANPDNDDVAWIENAGGGFSVYHLIENIAKPSEVFTADIDGDGDPDVVVSSDDFSRIVWYENFGGTAFSGMQFIDGAAPVATSTQGADLDGDGDIDVLATLAAPGRVVWYENLGGFFGPLNVIDTDGSLPFAPQQVWADDVDGDGDRDVVARLGDDFFAYENLGGTFGPPQPMALGTGIVRQGTTADLDADGDADLLIASQTGVQLSWVENLGGFVFGAPNFLSPGSYIAIEPIDVDNDGDLDIAASESVAQQIRVFTNAGGGVFFFSGFIATASNDTEYLLAADIDGDSDSDMFASASASGANPVWYENLAPIPDPYPGSGDDLVLSTGIDGAPSSAFTTKTAQGGDALLIQLTSPGGQYIGTVPALLAQVYAATSTVQSPGGFPEAWINPAFTGSSPIVTLYDGNAVAFGPGLLPSFGLGFGVTVPANPGGLKVILQGFALAPSASTGNPFFTATTAHEITLQP